MTGMDIGEVEALAERLSGSAEHLATLTHHVDRLLAGTDWQGRDAEQFRQQEWPHLRQRLHLVGTRLAESARTARDNASQQRDASRSTGAGTGSGRRSGVTGATSPSITMPGDWKWDRDRSPLYRTGKGDTDPVDPDDVQQGMLGDCFLLANLKAIAKANPEMIRRLIHDNGDGTYTVTFHDNGVPSTVIVDNEFPTLVKRWWFDDRVPFAKRGDGELWSRIIEKAYMDRYHGGYSPIPGGYLDDAISHLTGQEATPYGPSRLTDPELDALGARIAKHEIAVTTGTVASAEAAGLTDLFRSKGIVEAHAYAIQSIDPVNNMVHLANPHYANAESSSYDLVLTYDEYRRAFDQAFSMSTAEAVVGGGTSNG